MTQQSTANRFFVLCTLALAGALATAGCASKMRTAIAQTATVKGAPMTFGGTYDPRPNEVTLTVNGEPVMRGTFSPYTPTLNLNASYRGSAIRGECYFASILSSHGGIIQRTVATQVQGANGKAGDECKMFVDNAEATTIYF